MSVDYTEFTEITVIGDDETGLLAEITGLLYEYDINVEHLDQAVKNGLFRMTMNVDTEGMDCSKATLRSEFTDLCADLGVDVQLRFASERGGRSLAVLVTKESHCLEALLDANERGEFDADIEVVIGNHDDLEPLASQHDVPFHDIGDERGTPDEDELLDLLEAYDIDLVALARYIRILSPEVVFRYQHRIINVHPSLLPAFPGGAAYTQALNDGVRIAGVSAHYVTPDLDQGPIVTQRAFNVPDDADEGDLKRRGQPLEAEALVEAVRLHLEGQVDIGRGRTHVQGEADLGLPEAVQRANSSTPVDEPLQPATGTLDAADD